jgi:hypothetical protein
MPAMVGDITRSVRGGTRTNADWRLSPWPIPNRQRASIWDMASRRRMPSDASSSTSPGMVYGLLPRELLTA